MMMMIVMMMMMIKKLIPIFAFLCDQHVSLLDILLKILFVCIVVLW